MSLKLKVNFNLKDGMKDVKQFISSLKKADKQSVKYGYFDGKIHETEHDKSGMTLAALMYLQEFGEDSVNIPARPVFRQTGENMQDFSNSKALKDPILKYLMESKESKTPNADKMLLDIGKIMRKATQANFGAGNSLNLKSNATFTKTLKGRDDPLVHTGTLRDSIEVRTSLGGSD